VKKHPFFKNVDWDAFLRMSIPPPYVPKVVGIALLQGSVKSHHSDDCCQHSQHSATDISNFDEEFTKLKPVLTLTNSVLHPADQEEFRGFTYVSEWAQENRTKVGFDGLERTRGHGLNQTSHLIFRQLAKAGQRHQRRPQLLLDIVDFLTEGMSFFYTALSWCSGIIRSAVYQETLYEFVCGKCNSRIGKSFEQTWYGALVESEESFLFDYLGDGGEEAAHVVGYIGDGEFAPQRELALQTFADRVELGGNRK